MHILTLFWYHFQSVVTFLFGGLFTRFKRVFFLVRLLRWRNSAKTAVKKLRKLISETQFFTF
jgi:hypothetical protein